MKQQRILIIGATSAVAQGVAHRFAAQGARLFLLARDEVKTAVLAAELGQSVVGTYCYDFTNTDEAETAVGQASAALGGLDIVLIAHGFLPDQLATEHDFAVARTTFEINLLSAVSLLIPLVNQMEAQGQGKIGVITSVAGERGRPRNYTYGAAKGALTLYLQGVRSRLYGSSVEIYTFKMGPVDTPMTVDHPKNFSFSTVEQVSQQIVDGFARRRYEQFIPGWWRGVMGVVRWLPEWLFQRLAFLSGR